jgi:tRNA(Ile)-lysidine synthase TilS/MesJ/uncharacterized protein (DUF924 family)
MKQIYDTWFEHPEWWFNCGSDVDEYISKIFFEKVSVENVESYLNTKEDCIGAIIFFDQFPRHAYRGHLEAEHWIDYYLQYALVISDYIIGGHEHLEWKLSAYEWSFIYLPQRHSLDMARIFKTMNHTWKVIGIFEDENERKHMRKFLRATYERCPLLQNRMVHKYCPDGDNVEWNGEKYVWLLDFTPLKRSVQVFNDIDRSIQKLVTGIDLKKKYILSLSGGVDSMICSYILKNLGVQFCAVHINYCNRQVCGDEEEFLLDWCNYLGIDLYIRRLREIQRQPSINEDLRTIYEDYTRDVRYATYKYVWNEWNEWNTLKNEEISQVILGHNHDDCFENIMTNIAHCSKYDNLFGMQNVGIQDGICFTRPLLNMTKSTIYKLSRVWSIPHLPTSTPSWSMRGKIRDIVRPCLEKWHSESVNGFIELSETMTELYSLMNAVIDGIIEKMVEKNREVYPKRFVYGKWFCNMSELHESCLFWKILFGKLTKKIPSNKSLEYFKIHLNNFKNKYDRKLSIKINEQTHIELILGTGSEICVFITDIKF